MRIPPFLDLLDHEATPSWRSRAFWFDTRLAIAMPCMMIGLIIALYLLTALKLFATAIYWAVPLDAARALAVLLDKDVGVLWLNLNEAALYIGCIFIGENIARAALDIAALRPFSEQNAARFIRAALGTAALIAFDFFGRIAERAFGLPSADGNGEMLLFGGLAAACFASLSLSVRQGAALKKEQDLTV